MPFGRVGSCATPGLTSTARNSWNVMNLLHQVCCRLLRISRSNSHHFASGSAATAAPPKRRWCMRPSEPDPTHRGRTHRGDWSAQWVAALIEWDQSFARMHSVDKSLTVNDCFRRHPGVRPLHISGLHQRVRSGLRDVTERYLLPSGASEGLLSRFH